MVQKLVCFIIVMNQAKVKCHLVDTLYVSVGPCPTFSLTV